MVQKSSFKLLSILPFALICFLGINSISAQISIVNPGLNGPPGVGITPPGWVVCSFTPDTHNGSIHGGGILPYEGTTYLGIHPLPGQAERAAAVLSAPLTPGATYNITMRLSIAGLSLFGSATWVANNQGNNPGIMQIWGSTSGCTLQHLLWTSAVIEPFTGWNFATAEFTPPAAYTHLIFVPQIPPGGTLTPYMGVDDISEEVTAVPTLSQWGIIVLALALLNLGGIWIWRTKKLNSRLETV